MGCCHPLQAKYKIRSDGKKELTFFKGTAKHVQRDVAVAKKLGVPCLQVRCGNCIVCRLEKAREWAIRSVHEASCWEKNVFLTLTYAPEFLPSDHSLHKSVPKLFVRRLRNFLGHEFRYMYVGEYGDQFLRPHFHLILFNVDFPDKVFFKKENGHDYFISDSLSEVWSNGFSTISDVNYFSAAYVSRYCLKKINGKLKEDHYQYLDKDTGQLFPLVQEFSEPSRKPGLGSFWFDKYWKDVYPRDEVILSDGTTFKPPRYYDKLLEKKNPTLLLEVKKKREEKLTKFVSNVTPERLADQEKCFELMIKSHVRQIEKLTV